MTDRLTVVSTDCHAGLPISQYKPYVDSKYHDFIDMAVDIQIDMMDKAESQFLIKEINDEWRAPIKQELTGAWDYKERHKMLAKDGIAAEIIFPDEARFAASNINKSSIKFSGPGFVEAITKIRVPRMDSSYEG